MRRKKAVLISAVALAALVALSVPAAARMGRSARCMKPGMGDGMGPVLTEEQQEQIKDIHERYGDERVELANRVRVLRTEMKELATSDGEPDFDAIETKMEEIADARLEMAKLRLRIHQDVRPLLTEDQRKLFDARMGLGHMGGHGMRGCMQGMPGMGAGGMMMPGGMGQRCGMGSGGMGRGGMRHGGMMGRGCRAGGEPGMMMGGMPRCMSPMEPADMDDE